MKQLLSHIFREVQDVCHGKKRSSPVLKYYLGIFVDGVNKTTDILTGLRVKIPSQDVQNMKDRNFWRLWCRKFLSFTETLQEKSIDGRCRFKWVFLYCYFLEMYYVREGIFKLTIINSLALFL
jgi:hypothetical protein